MGLVQVVISDVLTWTSATRIPIGVERRGREVVQGQLCCNCALGLGNCDLGNLGGEKLQLSIVLRIASPTDLFGWVMNCTQLLSAQRFRP